MLRVRRKSGEEWPKLYRIAWYDFERREAVCYPVGIHWIAWAACWLWRWTYRQMWPDAWERACAKIERKERDAAREQWESVVEQWQENNARLRKENAELREAIRRYVLQVSEPPTPEELEAMGGKPETPPPPPPPKKIEGPGIWISYNPMTDKILHCEQTR